MKTIEDKRYKEAWELYRRDCPSQYRSKCCITDDACMYELCPVIYWMRMISKGT